MESRLQDVSGTCGVYNHELARRHRLSDSETVTVV